MCMKRRSFLRSSAAFVGASLLASSDCHADEIHPQHTHAASLMTECARRFLAALDPDQRGKVTFPFDTDERMNWHFHPQTARAFRCARRHRIRNTSPLRYWPPASARRAISRR